MSHPLPLPGWYPDPEGSGTRWWDGRAWGVKNPPTAPAQNKGTGWLVAVCVLGAFAALYVMGSQASKDSPKSTSSSTVAASSGSPEEDEFFGWLDKYGFGTDAEYRHDLLVAGRSVCVDLRRGVTPDAEARVLYRTIPSATEKNSGLFVTAAQMSLCPDTM